MKLSKEIFSELHMCVLLFFFGAGLRGIYFLLCDVYELLKQRAWIIAVGDFVFSLIIGTVGFVIVYIGNDGSIRLFFLGIALAGWWCFGKIVKISIALLKNFCKKGKIQ